MRDLGRDLQLHLTPTGGAITVATRGGDLAIAEGLDNLVQAVWLRLMTPLGELAHLGHPDYGSRLHLLIGRLINASTIALAKAYVREALRQEPRVERVDRIDVRPDPVNLGNLLIEMAVRPVEETDPARLAMTFALEPGQVEASTYGTTGR